MRYFINRMRFTKGDCVHGGFYYLFKNLLLNVVFWVGLFSMLGLMWLYVYQFPGLETDIIFIAGYCVYLFFVSKVYRQRICEPVVTVSWVFTGIYSLLELIIAIVCAGINAGMIYHSCANIPKAIGYFCVTLIFVYFCLRTVLISIIRNLKKSNLLFLLIHTGVISFTSTCVIAILLSNIGSLIFEMVMIVILISFFKSLSDGEWCPFIVFKM